MSIEEFERTIATRTYQIVSIVMPNPAITHFVSLFIEGSSTVDKTANINTAILGLRKAIKNTSRLLKEVKLMDVYYGKPLKKNEKSYSFSITLENDKKTLEDLEINTISKKIIDTISKKFNGVVRS